MKTTFLVSLLLIVALVGCAATTVAPTATAVPPTYTPAQEITPTATTEPVSTSTPAKSGQETQAPPTPTTQAATEPPTPTLAPTVEGPAWTPDGVIGEGEYANTVEAGGVQFYWSTDAEFLYGALSAKSTGWVAVGFDPQNKMQGANYIFGYVKDGQTFVEDMFGTRPIGANSHPPDTDLGGRNDILEFGGSEAGGVTVIEFKIPLDSGDVNDKPLRAGSSYKVILAWSNRDDFTSIHGGYGSTEINID